MKVSLGDVRARLALHAAGQLSEVEEARLVRDAKVLRRRLERLKALHPTLGVSLSDELTLLSEGALTASG